MDTGQRLRKRQSNPVSSKGIKSFIVFLLLSSDIMAHIYDSGQHTPNSCTMYMYVYEYVALEFIFTV